MGRIRYILFKISRVLPKTQRKPIILTCSLLGLMAFMNAILSITHSTYLLSLKQGIQDITNSMLNSDIFGWSMLFIILIICWCGYRYYKQLQQGIGIMYIVILILGILPWLIGV